MRMLLGSTDGSRLDEIWNGFWVGSVDGWLLRGAETKFSRSFLSRYPH